MTDTNTVYRIKARPGAKVLGQYIAGFNNSFVLVQYAQLPQYAKEFHTRKQAQRFFDNYADAGFGFIASDWEIEEVTR